MIQGRKQVVVVPAYNAEKTLQTAFDELPNKYVDEVILVGHASSDATVNIAHEMLLFLDRIEASPVVQV
jgi:glycosyltransferase involved in cell wall biosynthesis